MGGVGDVRGRLLCYVRRDVSLPESRYGRDYHSLISRSAVLASILPALTEKRAIDEEVNVRKNEIYVGFVLRDQSFEYVARIDRDMETVTF